MSIEEKKCEILNEVKRIREEFEKLNLNIEKAVKTYTRFWKIAWIIFLVTFMTFFTIKYIIL